MCNRTIFFSGLLLACAANLLGQSSAKHIANYKVDYQRFDRLNHDIDSLFKIRKTYLILKLVEVDSNEVIMSRHFIVRNPSNTRWTDRITNYNIISEAYLRNQNQDDAIEYVRKVLILAPEYLQTNKESDLKYLLPRFSSLKFTFGFIGWFSIITPRQVNTDEYQPAGATGSVETTRPRIYRQSSFLLGAELIANPELKTGNVGILRSIDLYSEIFLHGASFVLEHATDFSPESSKPTHVDNTIMENQRWVSFLLYPRIRFNLPRSDKWTAYAFAGGGVSFLKSAHFLTVNQSINHGPEVELSPVRLDGKEGMRNGRNISIVTGIGFIYRATENIGLILESRYLGMLKNAVSEYSHQNNPLQDSPLFYVDNDLFMRQFSFGAGLSLNIGACPKWLGF